MADDRSHSSGGRVEEDDDEEGGDDGEEDEFSAAGTRAANNLARWFPGHRTRREQAGKVCSYEFW